jgi:hypothetical protein
MNIIKQPKEKLSLYSNKYNSTVASRATPIGSADRTPDNLKFSTTMED